MTITEKCETAALQLAGIVALVRLAGFLFIIVGVFSILLEIKKVGFCSVLVSFWLLGLCIFYELYKPSKNEAGMAIPFSSRAGSSGNFSGAYVFVFFTAWFIGLSFMTVSFLQRVSG